jgi:hypothetical protein
MILFFFFQLTTNPPRPKKQEGGRHGIPPLKPLLPCRPTQFFVIIAVTPRKQRRVATPQLILADFQRKRFELHPKTSAISRKNQNRQKMEKAMQKAEGGAEFPPETPLPPRPPPCWFFWEFSSQMQKENSEKK